MNLRDTTQARLEEVLAAYPVLDGLKNDAARAAELICDMHRAGGKVLACGNGGSASDADHIVGEMVNSFALRRHLPALAQDKLREQGADGADLALRLQQGVAAIALSGQAALSTAIANDTGADMVFAQQVYVYGRAGDVLLGISTSGKSVNVLRALQTARAFGLKTIGLTGANPAPMDAWCDVVLKAPATETFRVQELHLPLYHALCLAVEHELFGPDAL